MSIVRRRKGETREMDSADFIGRGGKGKQMECKKG